MDHHVLSSWSITVCSRQCFAPAWASGEEGTGFFPSSFVKNLDLIIQLGKECAKGLILLPLRSLQVWWQTGQHSLLCHSPSLVAEGLTDVTLAFGWSLVWLFAEALELFHFYSSIAWARSNHFVLWLLHPWSSSCRHPLCNQGNAFFSLNI